MNSTHPLRIVNGEFMRGNNIEKPEIGNQEQIECLQAHEKAAQKAAEEAETKGIECEFYATNIRYTSIRYTSNIKLKCLCGKILMDSNTACDANDSDELEWLEQDWDDDIVICGYCGRKYEIQGGRAKLIKK